MSWVASASDSKYTQQLAIDEQEAQPLGSCGVKFLG
jgi:hypothetical protein